MTPQQRTALEALAGRALTQAEVEQIDPRLDPDNRNDVAIAAVLSVGRTRLRTTEIGTGTILAAFNGLGGLFIDTLQTIGETNRDVHWLLVGTILRGVLDTGNAATRTRMQQLMTREPLADFVPGMQALLDLGVTADPIPVLAVSQALNAAEGRMQMGA